MSKAFSTSHAKRIVVWFRQDLRLHDNEALTRAVERGEEVIPVYVFDERIFQGQTRFGFPKTGVHRTKFIIEAVQDLRESFQALGIDLYVRVGKPEEEVFKVAQETQSSWVFCNMERTQEEVDVQNALEQKLWSIGQELHFFRGKMLYHTQDLPFPVSQVPDVFTSFRKEVEKFIPIREPLPRPMSFTRWSFRPSTLGDMPTLEDFGHTAVEEDTRAVLAFKGGERAAIARLDYYLWRSNAVKTYKETRNELLGGDYSSKFSAWLAQGCLSPKLIYQEVKRYEATRGKNKSTYWLIFELLWRDFFRLMAKKYGNAIFQRGGILGKSITPKPIDWDTFDAWANGTTGNPFIDANMIELNHTGFMSNRGRQNVASYLVHDLGLNWQLGASYFESCLIDYDVCSNWGNWNYLAGVGNDPREHRRFNILKQARRYDPKGAYVKHWLPHLATINEEEIHEISSLSSRE